MKIVNILFNYKKSANQNQILGVERCFIDYSKNLVASGNSVLAITNPKMVYCDEVKKTGARLAEVRAANNADIFSMIRMAILFLGFKPDAIICHSGRALFLARAARFLLCKSIPIIAIDHGIKPKKFLKADYVLTVNSFFSSELVKAGKAPETALVIPNMIEVPKDFTPLVKQPFRKPIILGSLGRIFPEKNFDKILHAMAILRDRGIESEFLLGGVGPQEKNLKEIAKELNLKKQFRILGWTSQKRDFFDSIDIFVLPSAYETFGIVLLEAMLYSTPIITSNSWGPDEIISDGVDGLKVSRDDADAVPKLLADAIERMINNEEFAKGLAVKASEKFFANYSADKVIEKLNGIIAMVVSKRK
ncbi:MAG: glycosyltransferase family 4 protein [Rickettsiales bacterium]|nr:glycosyltransferase family 4 protein [Rickettsiales bacterium]